jgi:hypothetical protein
MQASILFILLLIFASILISLYFSLSATFHLHVCSFPLALCALPLLRVLHLPHSVFIFVTFLHSKHGSDGSSSNSLDVLCASSTASQATERK